MCSIITHPAVPLALSGFLPQENVSPALLLAGAVCSIIPDLDVVGFRFGISYGDILGHCGFTHSLLFAVILAALLMFTLFRNRAGKTWVILLFLFLSNFGDAPGVGRAGTRPLGREPRLRRRDRGGDQGASQAGEPADLGQDGSLRRADRPALSPGGDRRADLHFEVG